MSLGMLFLSVMEVKLKSVYGARHQHHVCSLVTLLDNPLPHESSNDLILGCR